MQGVLLLAGLDKARISRFYHYAGSQVLVGIQVNALRQVDHRIEYQIKFREPKDGPDARSSKGLLFGVFMSFPYRDVVVGLSEKQHFPPSWIGAVWSQKQDGLLLIDAAEVKQVVILPKLHGTIRIGW